MDSWDAVCRQCVTAVSDVPPSILLATVVATAMGLFVLVSSRSPSSSLRCARNLDTRPQLPYGSVRFPTHTY